MKNTRKKYSTEFKVWAVKTSIQYKSVLRVAEGLQISRYNLQHWKRLFHDGKLTPQKTSDSDVEKKEIVKLQREIKVLKLERDILKKELNIFTRRDGPDMNLSEKTQVNFPL
ncbi:transposase [Flavobacterium aestuarii]|uniref:transposase n=1 Tax=Flavobacterium aestuarii TaxID=3149227 RepID=UPI003EC09027